MKLKQSYKKALLIFLSVFFTLGIGLFYSRYIATSGLKVKEYPILSALSDAYHGFKIIQISDIHYGSTVHKKELENMVEKINSLKPDIVVLTGDLLDERYEATEEVEEEISSILKKIEAPIGCYAITGNHDLNFSNWERIIQKSGFINLNDNYELIYKDQNPIFLAGLSSSYDEKVQVTDKIKPILDYLESEENRSIYTILLLHEPDFIDEFAYQNFDLILSGHTHGGQVSLPFLKPIVLPKYGEKYYEPFYQFENTKFYISSGIGTSTINFRLFNRPSINLYRFLTK